MHAIAHDIIPLAPLLGGRGRIPYKKDGVLVGNCKKGPRFCFVVAV